MDLIEEELDKILVMINRLPDSDKKSKLDEIYKHYRNEFENDPQNTTVNSPLGSEIISFAARLELLYNVNGNVDDLKLKETNSVSLALAEKNKKVKPQNVRQLEGIFIEVLNESILSESIDSLQSKIKEIKEEYKELGSKNQELDEKIAQAEYTLMKCLLKEGRLDEAKELLSNFDTDMTIFLRKKLSPLIETLRKSERPQDALYVAKYCMGGELKEKSLEFWEKLINIEEPEINYKLPITNESIEEKNLIPKTTKKNIFQRMGERMKQVLSDAKEERNSHLKVVRIHYAPKVKGGINQRDYEYLEYLLFRSRKQGRKVKVVFEEGITEIALPREEEDFYFRGKYFKACSVNDEMMECIYDVDVPSTATEICDYAFCGCQNLKQVDLSNTNVTRIGEWAFYDTGITSIKFSNCLKEVGWRAFEDCRNLKQVVVSKDKVNLIMNGGYEGEIMTFEELKAQENVEKLEAQEKMMKYEEQGRKARAERQSNVIAH